MAKPTLVARLCQVWFALMILGGVIWFRLGTALVHALRPVTGQTFEQAAFTCTLWGTFVFKVALMLSPWLQLKTIDGKPLAWPEKQDPPPFFLMNHTSFLDFFVFSCSMPMRMYRETSFRTMVQAKLFNFALYGEAMRQCATFPVHFVKDEVGVYTVDREKQAKVSEDVNRHIAAGGSIGLCPEGQISRAPPTPLQSFRRGSFAIPIANGMPIWSLTMMGCHDSWPLNEAVGGFPATIYLSVDHLYTPKEGDEAAEVARICQERMQARVDALIAHRDAVAAKKTA